MPKDLRQLRLKQLPRLNASTMGHMASPIGIDVWTVADIDDRERRAPMKANNMYAEAATAVATKPMLHSRDGFA